MPRVTVYHLTPPHRLPLIEQDGLRTRADLSELFGEPDAFDMAAPGTFAHGKRVSAYVSLDEARTRTDAHGAGLVSFSVDPGKVLAARASDRDGDPADYWAGARPLSQWQSEGQLPDDVEVHTNVAVRAKYVRLHAPLLDDADLGDYAPIVAAVADSDRLSAKSLMHLAVIASDGDFGSAEFLAGCALAWRDEPDPERLVDELMETDPDKVASAALAEFGAEAPAAAARLREALDGTREWAQANSIEPGRALFARTGLILDELPAHVA